MYNIAKNIFEGKLFEASVALDKNIKEIFAKKMEQIKIKLTSELFEEVSADVDFVDSEISEANVQKMGRTKMIRVRIRNGKVQRRIKKSAVPGYTIRGGRMVRMSSIERRHRKMAARRSKFKRRAKIRQSIRKRQRSIRRLRSMGVR
jgi:hypothetical protein